MKSLRHTLAPALLTAMLVSPADAQKLPTGQFHDNREREYDISHYRAELRFDFATKSVDGSATIDLQPLRTVSSITLDAIGLDIAAVILEPDEALDFEVLGNSLVVALPQPGTRGDALRLAVTYRATPRAGMYFQPDRQAPGQYFVSTYGEGGLHANWLPIYGDVNDRFTTEMVITVPEPYVVISNGRLVSKTTAPENETIYHWRQDKPHPNYLVSLYIGDFERGDLEPAFGDIPLAYWVPRGRLAEGAYAFRNTTRMVEFFSDRFAYRYPWHKYDQIAVPDYAIGAMEHTGVTGHNASVLRHPDGAPVDFGGPTFGEYFTDWSAEATISHELAHHWFGNLVTCRNLSHLWLNESFASYLMMLWDEESIGRDQLDFDVDLARRHYLEYVDSKHLIRPLEYHNYDDPNTIYNTEHTYLKGAAVLHMLRGVLGDDDYFTALAYYLKTHAYGNVESRDLKIAIEESVGRNLYWFWEDWISGGGHPRFEVSSRYLEDRRQIDLTVRQVQPIIAGQDLFKLPVEITIHTPSASRTEIVWVEAEDDSFLLAADEEPLMVSFDGGGYLVAEIRFDKDPEELVYQATHDALPGRLRALRQIAERFPTRAETAVVLAAALDTDRFWGEQAEAARLLGTVRTPRAEELATAALEADDYRIRKAAVLALAEMGTATARQRLSTAISQDAHSDVVGAAIVALAKVDPETSSDVFIRQLERDAWYDEIRIAALQAMGTLDRAELVAEVRPFAQGRWNQDVRQAALAAWKRMAPTDSDLHAVLLDLATSPSYKLQTYALEMLGVLYVDAAVPFLEELEKSDIDENLTVLARDALTAIRRITPEVESPTTGGSG